VRSTVRDRRFEQSAHYRPERDEFEGASYENLDTLNRIDQQQDLLYRLEIISTALESSFSQVVRRDTSSPRLPR